MLKQISRWAGKLARSNLSRKIIPLYAKIFQIQLAEAAKPLAEYTNLTEFFTRSLKDGLRPVCTDANALVSPVDGHVAQFGKISKGMLLQSKGVDYSLIGLLGGDTEKASKFTEGTFITIYLSPRDYHRIHSPFECKVTAATYVPGSLFPVNSLGVNNVKGLFAKNERIITFLDSKAGEIALVKVGATIVGSVKVVYDAQLTTNIGGKEIVKQEIANGPTLAKGEELGRFEFGSTVILLFEPGKVTLRPDLKNGQAVKMGVKIGIIKL